MRRRALLFVALFVLTFPASTSARLTGELARFEQCPYDNANVRKCVFSRTKDGEVILGSKRVPIVNPVTLQGGYGTSVSLGGLSKFFAAKGGATLSEASQPVPGGLAGVVAPEDAPPLVKTAIAFFFENGITGVDATLELAGWPSEIGISENNLAGEVGVALRLPLKIRLDNPFLGSECYIGSAGSPLVWQLTSGTTEPPPPNEPIAAGPGFVDFLEEGSVVAAEEAKLADNAWSAPEAKGCGGFLSFLVDPLVNAAAGLPAKAGTNTAVLIADAYIGSTVAVRVGAEEGP
jgi:hypothetical protein